MRWTVDGDRGNLTRLTAQSAVNRYQQVDVDPTNWTWRDQGPYQVTFVATDLTGLPLGEQTVSVTLAP